MEAECFKMPIKSIKNREKYIILSKKQEILFSLFAFMVLLIFGFYINRYIRIEGLYQDDIYTWSCYGEQSFMDFAFPIGTSSRFRPVYWSAAYIELLLIGENIGLLVPVNIVLNVLIAFFIYYISLRFSRSRIVSLASGMLYLVSRFAYYQIGQALGLLESMALFMAIYVLYKILLYIADFKKRDFILANIMYFLLAFTHERYIAILPIFYIALIYERFYIKKEGEIKRKRRNTLFFMIPILQFILIFIIRALAIGKAVPAGTGGTYVEDTFSISQAFHYAFSEVFYILGMSPGYSYLSGIKWEDCDIYLHRLVYFSWIPLFLIVAIYIIKSIRNKYFKNGRFISENIIFLCFIAMCIGCSSVTIRLEMRWIYVSLAASLIYLSYMIGTIFLELPSSDFSLKVILKSLKNKLFISLILLFIMYSLSTAFINRYYRTYFSSIYFWENQERMNSLADETIGKYGRDAVFGKSVYILGNSYGLTPFYASTFFKPFDKNKTADGTVIHMIFSIKGLPEFANKENSIVLKEDGGRKYIDITDEIMKEKKRIENESGWYKFN